MNAKILTISILVTILASSTFSLIIYSSISEPLQVFAGKTLDDDDIAKTLLVRVMMDGEPKEKIFDSFSRIGFVRSSDIKFLLESIPSKDKTSFYDFISASLNSNFPKNMNISIDVISGDGITFETLNYKKCAVDSYFIHVNDSKGKFSFLDDGNSKMEIREVTQFICAGFTITT